MLLLKDKYKGRAGVERLVGIVYWLGGVRALVVIAIIGLFIIYHGGREVGT